MIVTFDIGARFSFLWRVLYLLLLFLVNICRTAKTVEEGDGGRGQYPERVFSFNGSSCLLVYGFV